MWWNAAVLERVYDVAIRQSLGHTDRHSERRRELVAGPGSLRGYAPTASIKYGFVIDRNRIGVGIVLLQQLVHLRYSQSTL